MALTAKRQAMALAGGYGASDVGTLAGLNHFSTPIEIYERRVHGKPEQESSLPADLGTLLEEPLAKKYAADTGLHLVPAETLRHREQTFALALCTPDRIAFTNRHKGLKMVRSHEDLEGAALNVQVKTASMWNRRQWGEAGSDKIPETYLAQVQWEMAVTGLRITDVPVLFDKAEFSIFRVAFDPDLFTALYSIVEKFHRDHVLAKVPPRPDASEQYKDFLSRRFTAGSGVVLDVPAGSPAEAEVLEYARLKGEAKRIDGRLKALSNSIRGAIGDAIGLSGSFGSIKWLRAPGKTYTDWEGVAKDAVADAGQLTALAADNTKTRAPYNQLRGAWVPGVGVSDEEE